ncbi:MAG: FAD-dependent oxidoreductase [Zoogloea sp.]|nr:MAG: FAD-dependent oxidoreductase [Zoogloea sp.]
MRTLREPARDLPVVAEPDVLVVGGGPAGLAAACAAARAGASTLLVEAYGSLGGTLTIVTLGGLCGIHAVIDDERLGRVVGGLCLEVEDRLAAVDAIRHPQRHGRIVGVPYDSVRLKGVLDEMTTSHGVSAILHTSAVAAVTDGKRVSAVIFENKGGRAAVVPRVVIDCTGDGDVAALAGAAFEVGAGGETQYGSAMFRLGGVDTVRAAQLSRPQIKECLERAVEAGYPLPRTATGVHLNPIEGVAHLNVTKLGTPDGAPFNLVDPGHLGDAEREGRRQVRMYEEVFRKYVPGFEKARVIDIGARVGVRETRLIRGDKVLTEAQVRNCEKPADRIACSSWPLESHGRGRGTTWEFLPDGQWYGIPWGCLVVNGFDNLLVAGRNLSAEHAAQASVRVAGPCMAMGEAAGTGAAASLASGVALRDVDLPGLQERLRQHGAILQPDW